jgi:hypothetical protein
VPHDGNNTTLMLVTVVGVFLAVEFPLAVLLIIIIVQHTFTVTIVGRQAGAVASLVINLVILLSYPTNFFIYCAMSRAFRTTFKSMFCWRSWGGGSNPINGGGIGGVVGATGTINNHRARDKYPTNCCDDTPANRYLPLGEVVVTQTTDAGSMRKTRRSVTQF